MAGSSAICGVAAGGLMVKSPSNDEAEASPDLYRMQAVRCGCVDDSGGARDGQELLFLGRSILDLLDSTLQPPLP